MKERELQEAAAQKVRQLIASHAMRLPSEIEGMRKEDWMQWVIQAVQKREILYSRAETLVYHYSNR